MLDYEDGHDAQRQGSGDPVVWDEEQQHPTHGEGRRQKEPKFEAPLPMRIVFHPLSIGRVNKHR